MDPHAAVRTFVFPSNNKSEYICLDRTYMTYEIQYNYIIIYNTRVAEFLFISIHERETRYLVTSRYC